MRKDWEVKKLGDVCEIFDSLRKPITRSKRISGNYPYYGASGVQDYIDSFIFDGRYLLVGEDGAKWGKKETSSYIIEGKSWVNNHVHVLRLNEYLIDSFVEYYLNYSDLTKYITGAVVPKLTQRALQSIIIPVPPLQTQQQIVEELDCLTSIIEKQKKQLEELDNLAQSIFYDMFGDPIENEKGWDILNLNQIGNFKNGLNFRKREKGHSIKVLGVGDFKDNKEIRDFKHIETVEISDEISDDYLLKDEDIVFIRSNGSKDLVGRCIIVFPNMQEITFSGFCIRFRRSDDNYISLFLLYLFKNEPFKRYYINRSNGCNINNISQTTLSIIPIPSPPLSLQQQFASKIEAIEKQKELIKKSIKETEDLFNSRMDYYFN